MKYMFIGIGNDILLFMFFLFRNIVLIVNFGCKLDLKKIVFYVRNVEYNFKVWGISDS